jgi:membrane protease subunit HflC
MQPRQIMLVALVLLVVGTILDSAFVVNQQQQALVLRFREAMREIREPGLYFKVPMLDSVTYFDKRVLPLEATRRDTGPDVTILSDRKQIIVDAFARYRITDPLKFFQRLNNERNANTQLYEIVNSSTRQVLGTFTMKDLLSDGRVKIMHMIKDDANRKAKDAGFGVEFVDVRVRRADLPEQTSQAIFARMRSEREREAKEFRAKGEEDALKTRSTADKERVILLAEARAKAEAVRGEGDLEGLNLMAAATSKDPKFYDFYRSLQAYRTTLADKDTTLVLSPDSPFFKYFGGSRLKE